MSVVLTCCGTYGTIVNRGRYGGALDHLVYNVEANKDTCLGVEVEVSACDWTLFTVKGMYSFGFVLGCVFVRILEDIVIKSELFQSPALPPEVTLYPHLPPCIVDVQNHRAGMDQR